MDPDALPNDPAALQQMLRELYSENDKLRLLIERLTRHQFGRRSEQLTMYLLNPHEVLIHRAEWRE
jgi:transposase